jgi:ribose 1,5-bisphosphokinase
MTDVPAQKSIGPGRLILVVGPSGGGKDTIIAGAKEACAGNPAVVFPRRVVTRAASTAEDHDTLDDAAFDEATMKGGFAFWWEAHGLKYGIPHGIDDDIRAGRTVVCNVSRAVVSDLRVRYANVDAILVTAPAAILAARLAARARNSDGPLDQRLKRSDAYAGFRADCTINNDGARSEAVRRLLSAIGL